jgi:hypothetical protein
MAATTSSRRAAWSFAASGSRVSPKGLAGVEPGGARTEFRYGSLQLASPLAAYDDTPAALVRGVQDRSRPPLGDPAKMAARMIDSVDIRPAPRRIVMGSDSYRAIHTALTERLAELEAQQDTAADTDIIQ